MTENQPQTTSELGRRSLLRKGMLTGLGVAALSIATPVTAMAAPRASTSTIKTAGATPLATSLNIQTDWWFCTACKGLFWVEQGSSTGYCRGNDYSSHIAGSTLYWVPYSNPRQTGLQVGWRWCVLCSLLFWGPDEASSFCPAGFGAVIPHQAGGTVYDMMVTGYWTGDLQSAWRY